MRDKVYRDLKIVLSTLGFNITMVDLLTIDSGHEEFPMQVFAQFGSLCEDMGELFL